MPAKLREGQVPFAGDNVVGQLHDWLRLGLETDLRSAQHNHEVGTQPFEGGDDFRCRRNAPDVNPKPNDFRTLCQECFDDVERALVEVKLDEGGVGLQWAEVSEQVTQPERGMQVPRVECSQDNIGHCSNLSQAAEWRHWQPG